jgi:SAM-dependent methyltransferase
LPKVAYLDPRPAYETTARPIADSVNIPLAELGQRVYELPKKTETVVVAAEELLAGETIDRLREMGWKCRIESHYAYREVETAGRLWSPNGFLESVLPSVEGTNALDLACGVGREAVYLASCGWTSVGADILPDALERGSLLRSRYRQIEEVSFQQVDLTRSFEMLDSWQQRFDLVCCFFFLDRTLLGLVPQMLRPGGHVLIETFTTAHRERFGKPDSDKLVLQPDELRSLLPQIKIRSYEEGLHEERITARLHGTLE